MSNRGSAIETGFAQPALAASAGAVDDVGMGSHRGLGGAGSSPSGLCPGAATHAGVVGACAATAAWLRQRQAADGHWRGPLEGDTILESEYLLILAW